MNSELNLLSDLYPDHMRYLSNTDIINFEHDI